MAADVSCCCLLSHDPSLTSVIIQNVVVVVVVVVVEFHFVSPIPQIPSKVPIEGYTAYLSRNLDLINDYIVDTVFQNFVVVSFNEYY